ncbi:MAG TPA: hypothetical protein VGB15_15350 [Longimicrobium sp.]|jgi:hypothetical protein
MSLSRKARRARQAAGRGTSDLKMSEVLTDVALPLLEQVPDGDAEGHELALRMGGMLWNASRESDEQAREKTIAQLVALADEHGAAGIEALCREVIARAQNLYPHMDRIIARVEVTPLPGGRYNVVVASAG